jgi:hydroxymethylbilane synthase
MNKKHYIRLGTRGSALALWQADFIGRLILEHHPGTRIEIKKITTQGDRDQVSSLTGIGGQGIFTKAIEDALLHQEIDIAVHSLKDLPSRLDDRLELAAVPRRTSIADVLITPDGKDFNALRNGAVIGSSSLRRRAQLLHLRNDLQMRDLRGNIETRIRKLKTGVYDAIVMAEAALLRLQIKDVVYMRFRKNQVIPAVGQGAIGIEIRTDDVSIAALLASINHRPTFTAVTAERAFLRTLDSGCQFPVGAHAVCRDDQLVITGFSASEDGKKMIKARVNGSALDPEGCGKQLAEELIAKGAWEILE